jgi:hypothetical protein
MVHPAPVNGGDLALGSAYVTLRHLAILLIALAAASPILQRERARHITGGSDSAELLLQQLDLVTGLTALLAVDVRERAPFARALVVVPKPTVHALRLGVSAEQLLAVC